MLKVTNGRTNGENSSVCDAERTDSESELGRTHANKRIRRSSVLSIDFNEDDALVISSNGDVVMTSDIE